MDPQWQPDVLGPGYESATLETPLPDGGVRVATLVRHLPAQPAPTDRVVLFLHGWSDYFFNRELAAFWADEGFSFYALDLHNHGRSLRPSSLGGYVGDLSEYDLELEHALAVILRMPGHADGPVAPPKNPTGSRQAGSPAARVEPAVVLMGHSTGGLVAAWWAGRHPGRVTHLVLNSPWLEFHGSPLLRRALSASLRPIARRWPEARVPLPERNFYWRSISTSAGGEWELDDRMRPPGAFPVRVGWLQAVLAAQRELSRGLRIDVPVLVLLSARSLNGMLWREAMRRADAVLDVRTMADRARTLGGNVSLETIDGGLHDVLLSPPPVRQEAYRRLHAWIAAHLPADGVP
ncbi:MAG: alpha/beta hydrolase [Micrococcaceae bacterium]|nr:alpha/beta hydrolase [Micrococcaceae bacterium]